MADLAVAARALEARHGLASIEGGRHRGFGTANRIVPLGDTYLELIAVVDAQEAAGSAFGSWVAGVQPARARPLGWVVRTHDLAAVARRLDFTIGSGSRTTRSGVLRWRMGGVERAAGEPALPFFIEWAPRTPFPGRAPARHPAGDVRLARLHLDGDPERIADWLGAHDLPIAVRRGSPAVARVVLAGPGGEIVLEGDQL